MVCKVAEMMRGPPGDPSTMTTFPVALKTKVGVIDESGVLKGAISLATDPVRPYAFGLLLLRAKSSISSFMTMPVPSATMQEPNV